MCLGGFLGQCLLTNQIGFWRVGAAGVSMWSGSQSDFGMTVMSSTRAVLYCLFVVVVVFGLQTPLPWLSLVSAFSN